MRCFLAIDVPEDLKKRFKDVQESFSELARIKDVEHDNLHITLKFFGDIEDVSLNKIKDSFLKIEDNPQFEIEFKDIGAFPRNDYARVIWAGISGLDDFQEKVTKIAEKCGFESKREDKPHLTLGRVKSVERKTEFVKKIGQKMSFGKMRVKEVKLKKSFLTKKGPVYGDLYVFKLKTEDPS